MSGARQGQKRATFLIKCGDTFRDTRDTRDSKDTKDARETGAPRFSGRP
jgi:hypothetical protein